MMQVDRKQDLKSSLIQSYTDYNLLIEDSQDSSFYDAQKNTDKVNIFTRGLYGFFSVKIYPGQKSKQPRIMQWTYELPQKFEEVFWDFDQSIIEFIQAIHVKGDASKSKMLRIMFAIFSFLFAQLFTIELWVAIILYISMNQYDSIARDLTHCLLTNIIIVQVFKRFCLRKRPQYYCQIEGKNKRSIFNLNYFNLLYPPPRALTITGQRSSSFPSRVVVLSTTLFYTLLQNEQSTLKIELWQSLIVCFGVFVIASITRVHLGSSYPSDCLLSLPFISFVVAIFHGLQHFSYIFGCQSDNIQQICYSKSQQTDLNLDTFILENLFTYTPKMILLIGVLLFIILTSFPMEFWRKTPFVFGHIMAVYMFNLLILNPNEENLNLSVPSKDQLERTNENTYIYLQCIQFIVLTLILSQAYIVNNYLGRRVAQFQSISLRLLFFLIILFSTLMGLIFIRLVLVQGKINKRYYYKILQHKIDEAEFKQIYQLTKVIESHSKFEFNLTKLNFLKKKYYMVQQINEMK